MFDAFHEKGWRAENIYELMKDPAKYLEQVPESERWNLFYTVGNCTEEKRKFLRQDVLPIDIDGIVHGEEDKIVDVVCAELKLPKDKLGIVYSGNGIHILIGLKTPITDASYIRANKPYYKALCGRINIALYEAGIQGKADPVVFSEARLLRMPFTENIKEGKATRTCSLINGNLEPLDVDLFALSDLPSIDEGEHIHPRALIRLPKPDTRAVQEQCNFLTRCRTQQETVSEPEWYAMLSIVGRLENGDRLVHEYSKNYSGYNEKVTDDKLAHALEASGPRTCSNISAMHEGCQSCPHFGKITSPIQLIGEDTIRTLETGFYNIVIKDGVPKQGKPNYDDLVKYFEKQHQFVSVEGTNNILIWTGTHWAEMDTKRIHAFAEEHFDPTPSNSMCMEFQSKLQRKNLRADDFTIVQGKLNFQNGVLDLESGELEPHSPRFGFTYTIPYDYAPTGQCPTFEKFLGEITCEDDELAKLLTEYMGYCLSGADPSLVQKCAVLYGDGANGKSVLLQLMRELVGTVNCTSISIPSFSKDNYRYQLRHKMFNVSDEAPTDSFVNSSIFKAIVSGDTIEVRKLYADPVMWKCTTKLMFACNDLPFTGDFTHGMFRRLIIIPFRATFNGNKRDPFILNKLLEEKSDIFAYCLRRYKELQARSYQFTESKESISELTDFIEDSDYVARFVDEMCETTTKDDFMQVQQVFNLFCLWCDDNRVRPITYEKFTKRFKKRVTTKYPKVEWSRPRTEGQRITGYKYLQINAVSPAQMQTTF